MPVAAADISSQPMKAMRDAAFAGLAVTVAEGAGAHGKTTSTGMIITGLLEQGIDPSFVNGGVIAALGSSSAAGSSDLFIIEADESDGSFLHYDTAVALITNVDADHLDHYGTEEAFEAEFARFAQGAREFVAVSADDPGAVRVTNLLRDKRVIRFGFAADADVRLTRVDASGPRVNFSVSYAAETLEAELSVPGEHNAITDVPGVRVGHVTLFHGADERVPVDALEFGAQVLQHFLEHC